MPLVEPFKKKILGNIIAEVFKRFKIKIEHFIKDKMYEDMLRKDILVDYKPNLEQLDQLQKLYYKFVDMSLRFFCRFKMNFEE